MVQLPVNLHLLNWRQSVKKPGLCFWTICNSGRRNAILNYTNTAKNIPQIKLALKNLQREWLNWTGFRLVWKLEKNQKYHIDTWHYFMLMLQLFFDTKAVLIYNLQSSNHFCCWMKVESGASIYYRWSGLLFIFHQISSCSNIILFNKI